MPQPPAPSDEPYLLPEDTGAAPIWLSQEELSIGRATTSDIRLSSPQISRAHARLTRRGPAVILTDSGSTNGTFVNGRRVEGSVELREGDRIDLGGVVRMVFHAARAPAQAPQPAVPPAPGRPSAPPPVPINPAASPPPAGPPTAVPPPMASAPSSVQQRPQAALEGIGYAPVLLAQSDVWIGSDPGNTVALPDPGVAARHARIENQNGHFILSDLGSETGTYLNETRLGESRALEPGDVIRFGQISFIFRRLTPAPRRAPPFRRQ